MLSIDRIYQIFTRFSEYIIIDHIVYYYIYYIYMSHLLYYFFIHTLTTRLILFPGIDIGRQKLISFSRCPGNPDQPASFFYRYLPLRYRPTAAMAFLTHSGIAATLLHFMVFCHYLKVAGRVGLEPPSGGSPPPHTLPIYLSRVISGTSLCPRQVPWLG